MTRPSFDSTMLQLATVIAQRGTCVRRQVGCVAVSKRGHILAMGYNGVPSKLPHCNEGFPCPGAKAKSGESLDECYAVHAEINMLAQCKDVFEIETIYTTTSPCIHCIRALVSTSCQRIIFIEEYPHEASKEFWIRAGRKWEKGSLS